MWWQQAGGREREGRQKNNDSKEVASKAWNHVTFHGKENYVADGIKMANQIADFTIMRVIWIVQAAQCNHRVLKNGRRVRGDVTTKAGSDRHVRMVLEDGEKGLQVKEQECLPEGKKARKWILSPGASKMNAAC